MAVPIIEPPAFVDIDPDIPEGTVSDIRGLPQRVPVPGFFPPSDVNKIIYGPGHGPSWSDVWDWTKNSASDVLGWFQSPPSLSEATVQRIVETFVGQSQKAITSFIDDAVNFAAYGLNAVNLYAITGIYTLFADIQQMALDFGALRLQVATIDWQEIPALFNEIGRIGNSIEPAILHGLANVETWAIDNIFTPLYENIGQAEAQARDYTNQWASAVAADAHAYTLASVLPIWSVLQQIQAKQLAQEALNNDCTTPMCDVMGPKTDLGKWLKALNIAATAALLAELAALDGNGIETLLRGLIAVSGGVIDDIDAVFTGGESIGSAFLHAGT
jgi:hypothetical protein